MSDHNLNKWLCNFIVLMLFWGNTESYSQVFLNTLESDSSAILEVRSTSRGFLIPRLNTVAINNLSDTGLLMYNSTENYFNYYSDTSLNILNPWKSSFLEGNKLTIDFEDVDVKIGIGVIDPKSTLEVNGTIKFGENPDESDVQNGTLIFHNDTLKIKTENVWKNIIVIKL